MNTTIHVQPLHKMAVVTDLDFEWALEVLDGPLGRRLVDNKGERSNLYGARSDRGRKVAVQRAQQVVVAGDITSYRNNNPSWKKGLSEAQIRALEFFPVQADGEKWAALVEGTLNQDTATHGSSGGRDAAIRAQRARQHTRSAESDNKGGKRRVKKN